MNDMINCGQRRIQGNFRVAIMDVCKNNDIVVGDIVEIFIKKVNYND